MLFVICLCYFRNGRLPFYKVIRNERSDNGWCNDTLTSASTESFLTLQRTARLRESADSLRSCTVSPLFLKDQVRSKSNLTDYSDRTTYTQEDYDVFARSSSSVSVRTPRAGGGGTGLKRPGSGTRGRSAAGTREPRSKISTSLRSNSYTCIRDSRHVKRHASVSPVRRQKVTHVAFTKSVTTNQKSSNSRSESSDQPITKLISRSSETVASSDDTDRTSQCAPADACHKLRQPAVSDEGHQCHEETRSRSRSRSRSRVRGLSTLSDVSSSAGKYISAI